jgi:hypothetical protein
MYEQDFEYVMKVHPNSCRVAYAGGSTTGVFSNIQNSYLNELGTMVNINTITLAFLTSSLPTINKKQHPTIQVNGTSYVIKNQANESSLITSLDLEL